MTSTFDKRLRRCRADPLVGEDRHLAEHLPWSEDGQQHRVPRSPPLQITDPPADQHVHRVAGLTLVIQVGLRRDLRDGDSAPRERCVTLGKRREESKLLDDDGHDTPTRNIACWNTHRSVVTPRFRVVSFTHEDERHTRRSSSSGTASFRRRREGAGRVDRRSSNRLVKAAARRVLRCTTDVDDAVQDTWLNFVRFGDRIADPERVGAWLWTSL